MKHLILFGLLVMAGLALAAEPGSQALLAPPPHFRFVQKNGHAYYKGTVHLEAQADTALLKPFGFCNLMYLGRGFHTVKFDALWPKSVPLDSLPLQVVSLEYDAALATRPELFLFFGWPGPNVLPNPRGTYLQTMHNARGRYAVPDDGVGNVEVDGAQYVTGRIALWDAADTTTLKKLGFRQFYRPSADEMDVLEDLPDNFSSQWLQIQFLHCRWPVRLDIPKLPDSVIDLASDSVLRHNYLSLKRVFRYDAEAAPVPKTPRTP